MFWTLLTFGFFSESVHLTRPSVVFIILNGTIGLDLEPTFGWRNLHKACAIKKVLLKLYTTICFWGVASSARYLILKCIKGTSNPDTLESGTHTPIFQQISFDALDQVMCDGAFGNRLFHEIYDIDRKFFHSKTTTLSGCIFWNCPSRC